MPNEKENMDISYTFATGGCIFFIVIVGQNLLLKRSVNCPYILKIALVRMRCRCIGARDMSTATPYHKHRRSDAVLHVVTKLTESE